MVRRELRCNANCAAKRTVCEANCLRSGRQTPEKRFATQICPSTPALKPRSGRQASEMRFATEFRLVVDHSVPRSGRQPHMVRFAKGLAPTPKPPSASTKRKTPRTVPIGFAGGLHYIAEDRFQKSDGFALLTSIFNFTYGAFAYISWLFQLAIVYSSYTYSGSTSAHCSHCLRTMSNAFCSSSGG